ncbi:MaoC family dehydratase [Alteromonas gilva]|uniref:MaoC/PaaZ C-terminal domain-containing protein n=1 Tax=Alteromonas gilva TaxID=2987522 RepID=A0ABT5KXH4_9ALTE|nr:MaoC/PaaZ C-terminal domain-containing protein [Alteromonas gilva]MDC8829470.1 MaoC/PaaZ C-terminal domain-containing protein [Alteromonas gilva]
MKQIFQLVKAATKKADKPLLEQWFSEHESMALPEVATTRYFTSADYRIRLNAFNQLHDWHKQYLHPCFPQLLGLSQHISALSHSHSPFSLIGLVHVGNEIRQYQPLSNEELCLHCYFDKITPHQYGVQVDINTNVSQGGKHCQTLRSTYLYRLPSIDILSHSAKSDPVPGSEKLLPLPEHSQLQFKSGIGRQYARISGDYNPIHLAKWSARLAGFKDVMAHGMHVLAMTLSKLNHNWQLPLEKTVIASQFSRPVLLPSSLTLKSSALNSDHATPVHFDLTNPSAPRRRQSVMSGEIRKICVAKS